MVSKYDYNKFQLRLIITATAVFQSFQLQIQKESTRNKVDWIVS